MTIKKKALGRGLSALISTPPVAIATPAQDARAEGNLAASFAEPTIEPEPQPDPEGEASPSTAESPRVRFLPTYLVAPNPDQPRRHFSAQEIEELSASLKTLGVLQPILVRPRPFSMTIAPTYADLADAAEISATEGSDPVGDPRAQFEIVAGERRWRAACKAGLESVPVIVMELGDQEALEIALVENVQRENLNPMEEAEGYGRLAEGFQLSQQQIAERVGKDRATVANFLRILKLPKEIQELIRSSEISLGHAKVLLSVREPKVQLNLARKVLDERLSVRALEAIVAREVTLEPTKAPRTPGERSTGSPSREPFPELIDLLRKALGTKVSIRHARTGVGRIEISYFSQEELDRLVDRICE